MQNPEFKQKFDVMVESAEKILVTTHHGPDTDAIASLLGLTAYLKSEYPDKKIDNQITGPKSEVLNFIDLYSQINWVSDIAESIENYDLGIFLDGPSLVRFSHSPEIVLKAELKKIVIDHHPGEGAEFDLRYIDQSSAACAQTLFEIFGGELLRVSPNMAEILLYGILADTGTLWFVGPHNSRVLSVVQEIVDKGNQDVQILTARLGQISKQEFDQMKILINNTGTGEDEQGNKFTYSFVMEREKQLDDESLRDVMRQYLHMFMRKIKDCYWGFVVIPTEKGYQVSFRSLPGSVDVGKLAESLGGGGHAFAAAAQLENREYKNVEQVVDVVLKKIAGS